LRELAGKSRWLIGLATQETPKKKAPGTARGFDFLQLIA
jgi:sugar phosphate permease